MDRWLHTNFFPKPWHVALVIDPQNDQGGFFPYREAIYAGDSGALVSEQDTPIYLDARRYVGFYELGDPTNKDITAWRNLEPEEVALEGTLWAEGEAVKG